MQVPKSGTTAETVVTLAHYLDCFQALTHAAKMLTQNLNLADVLDALMRSVSQLIQPRNWSLLLVDDSTGELYFEIAVGDASDAIRNMRLRVGEGIAGWVAQHQRPLIVPRVADDPRFCDRMDSESRFQTSCVLCVPLLIRGKTLGVIELVRDLGEQPFSTSEQHLLEPFADFAAIAIYNARSFQRIEELTIIDEWTSLYNARFLKRYVDEEVTRARRYNHELSLIFLDLDGFKSVNDTHGHSVGSNLLRKIGNLLREGIRETDRPVRYGGDEFLVVMPETGKEGAMQLAWRLQESLASAAFSSDAAKNVRLSASFGVANFPTNADSPATLIDAADRAMYAAKARGRNTVVDASELEPAGAP